MAGTKRAAESDTPESSGMKTRGSKAAKVEKPKSAGKKAAGGKKGPKAPATSAFKGKAMPLHVNLTHTPPSIPDADSAPATMADPGSIGSLTLVPSTFATGSYGWKGSKRIAVELMNDTGDQKEKVTVMLTINAAVVGSKQAEGEEDAEGGKAEENADEKTEQTTEEKADENMEEKAEQAAAETEDA